MKNAWVALLSSRKWWVGTLTVGAVIAATTLVALGKLPAAQLVPTIAAITATGMGVIGAIAWEDVASKASQNAPGPSGKGPGRPDSEDAPESGPGAGNEANGAYPPSHS